jgi:flagellar biosynthetic protein FlhB
MAESAQDRKLPASQRKIEKSRKEGQVARSRDLGHFGAIGAGVGLLTWFAPDLTEGATRLLVESLRFDATTVMRPAALVERLSGAGLQMLLTLLLPLLGAVLLVAAAAGLLAGGWNFTLQPVQPDFTRIGPLSGLRRVFSIDQLTNTLKACFMAVVMGTVVRCICSRTGRGTWSYWPCRCPLHWPPAAS